MDDKQIKHLVDRFLMWRLPDDFLPDGGISFTPTYKGYDGKSLKFTPIGTNLFTATQAEAMFRHVLNGLPTNNPNNSKQQDGK